MYSISFVTDVRVLFCISLCGQTSVAGCRLNIEHNNHNITAQLSLLYWQSNSTDIDRLEKELLLVLGLWKIRVFQITKSFRDFGFINFFRLFLTLQEWGLTYKLRKWNQSTRNWKKSALRFCWTFSVKRTIESATQLLIIGHSEKRTVGCSYCS